MDFEQLQKKYGDFRTPRFELSVGETDPTVVTETDGLVSGLRVETSVEGAGHLSVTLTDGYDHESGGFVGDLRGVFEPGALVDVRAGYGEARATEHLLRGRIASVRPRFPAEGSPTVSVSGYDLRHDMSVQSGVGSWEDEPVGRIVEDVVDPYAFAGTNVDDAGVTAEAFSHPERSDRHCLVKLARKYGFEFFSRAGEFHFREPSPGTPPLTLGYGRALTSFDPGDRGGSPTVGEVTVRHWNETERKPIEATAEVPGGGSETRVRSTPVRSVGEARRRARSEADRLARAERSRGETVGIPDLRIGTAVELEGLGEFGGDYRVEEAVHRIDASGYTTAFTVSGVDA